MTMPKFSAPKVEIVFPPSISLWIVAQTIQIKKLYLIKSTEHQTTSKVVNWTAKENSFRQ